MTVLKQKIAKRLQQTREASGMSRVEVAQRLKSSESTIGNYERGTRHPDIDTFQKLAEIYKTSISYLLCLDDIETVDIFGDNVPDSLKDLKINYLQLAKDMQVSGIPPEDLKKLIETVKQLKK